MPTANQAFGQLIERAKENDVTLEQTGSDSIKILVGENSIDVATDGKGLAIKITATSESSLYFLREAAVHRLAELNGQIAERLAWDNDEKTDAQTRAPSNFHVLNVLGRSEPLQGLIRLRLTGNSGFQNLAGPGIHVKLALPVHSGRSPVWPIAANNGTTIWPTGEDELHVRYYTIKSCDTDKQELEIDIVRHEGGFIADWAETAQHGDEIGLMGPGGGERPTDTRRLLIAGDQTALPALCRMLDELAPDCTGCVIGAARSSEELKAYLPKTDLEVFALPPERFQVDVVEQAKQLGVKIEPEFAWFAGEYKNAQDMRKLFKSELGLGKGRQFSITYWRAGQIYGRG